MFIFAAMVAVQRMLYMANDFHYGIGACGPGPKIPGLKVEALQLIQVFLLSE